MNILIVDDEPMVLAGMERVLRAFGPESWDIAYVESGARAIEVMATTNVDLLISDMRMPGMDGIELLSTTAARWPRIARFALSGEASELQAIRATGLAHQFLAKPCSPELMLETLTKLEALVSGSEAATVRAIVSSVSRLPALPDLFAKLQAVLSDPRSDSRAAGEVIRQDPGIAAKVIQLANSSFFFRGSTITDVYGAVAKLGLRLISRLVLVEGMLATAPALVRFGYEREARQFFRASLLADAVVSPQSRDPSSLAVLLCPIGRNVMIAADPDRVDLAISIADSEGISIMEAERRVFGTCHAAVGGYLLSLWGLPSVVTDAVMAQHSPAKYRPGDEVLAAVLLANRDVRGLELGARFMAANGATELVTAWDRHQARLGDAL